MPDMKPYSSCNKTIFLLGIWKFMHIWVIKDLILKMRQIVFHMCLVWIYSTWLRSLGVTTWSNSYQLLIIESKPIIFDGPRQKFDLDFAGQKRFGCFRVNETPKGENFLPIKNSTGTVKRSLKVKPHCSRHFHCFIALCKHTFRPIKMHVLSKLFCKVIRDETACI